MQSHSADSELDALESDRARLSAGADRAGIIPFPGSLPAPDAHPRNTPPEPVPARTRRLLELTRSLAGYRDLSALLDATVRGAMELVECDGGFAASLTAGGRLRTRRYQRRGRAYGFERTWAPGEATPGRVLESGLPCLGGRPEVPEAPGAEAGDAVRSFMGVPILDARGTVKGCLVLHNRRGGDAFSEADVELVEELAQSASHPLENATAFSRIQSGTGGSLGHRQAQRLQEVGRLTGGIAHDLNNLLTVVLAGADLLLPGSAGQDAEAEDLREIRGAALRARSLTRRLLAFSREDPAEDECRDVRAHLEGTSRLVQRLVGPHVAVRTELAQHLPAPGLTGGALDQIVVNLAVNARDAMPRGGTLTLRAVSADGPGRDEPRSGKVPSGLRIEVCDTGEGMAPHVRERIFEPYYTTKAPDRGTGLGLSTVAEIVRGAGGRIRVRTAPGAGTAFCIYLPGTRSKRAGHRRPHERPRGHDGGEGTILLVEDDDSVRRLVRRALERDGHRVLEAADGRRAIEIASDGRDIDLLLTDVILPDIGGVQLWRLLHDRIPGGRTIFTSGYLEDELSRIDLERSDVEFLPKPFAIGDLLDLVERLLARS